VRENAVELDKVKVEELPENMQKMSADERKDYLKKQGEERDNLTARVNELSKQRQAGHRSGEQESQQRQGRCVRREGDGDRNGQVNRKK
jgi:hypothetical protein